MTVTDGERIDNLMATQRMLFARLDAIAKHADTLAEQVCGPLVANINYGFRRISEMARGKV